MTAITKGTNMATSHAAPIQYGPPPLRPGYRWETRAEELARYAAMDCPGHDDDTDCESDPFDPCDACRNYPESRP